MKAVILRSSVLQGAGPDEDDVLVQAETVAHALGQLGCPSTHLPFSMDVRSVLDALSAIRPAFVFNLVETMEGSGRLIHVAPALLDHLKVPYTGAKTEAIFLTSNKLLAKRILRESKILTPLWGTLETISGDLQPVGGPWIIKSVWEHASLGIADDSVLRTQDRHCLLREMKKRVRSLGGECFAEAYVEGREFNLSLLAGKAGPEVLPPAEILFGTFPEGKTRVVGYLAKWEPESFEYENTPRCFDFSEGDTPLIGELTRIAKECWRLFGLRGYARVDFRVDEAGMPWVLEVNANPCLAPDAGFLAAAKRGGLSVREVVCRIVRDSLPIFCPQTSDEGGL